MNLQAIANMAKVKKIAAMYVAFGWICANAITFQERAIAQYYSGCFMLTESGNLVDLNSLCGISDRQANSRTLEFSQLQFQPSSFGNFAEVRGTVTNRSEQIIPLQVIYIRILNENRFLSSSTIPVDTGNGLSPGQSLTFDKVINRKNLGGVIPATAKVEVTQYQ